MQEQSADKTKQLVSYTLHLADNALILGHRNSEWCGYGPVPEQDIALANITLDLLGQARNFYQYAAKILNDHQDIVPAFLPEKSGSGQITEDRLAYLRDSWDFKNCLLAEQSNGDFAKTILRQFFFSTYQYYLYRQLQYSTDKTISEIAEKALKEVTYHVRWSSEWVIRLGDGTEESHQRIAQALDDLWSFTGELFEMSLYETELLNDDISVDSGSLYEPWINQVKEVLIEAALALPSNGYMQTGGKSGIHTEALGYILAEMQYLQRAYPDSQW